MSTHATPRPAASLLDLPDEVLLAILVHLGLQPTLTARSLRLLQPAFNLSLTCIRLHRLFCTFVRSIDLQTAGIIHEPFSSLCEHSAPHIRSLLKQLHRLDTVTLTENTASAADALLHENESERGNTAPEKNSDDQTASIQTGVRRLKISPSSGRLQTSLTRFPKSCRELVLSNPSADTLQLLASTYVASTSPTSTSTSTSTVQDRRRTAHYHSQKQQQQYERLSQLRDLTLSHVDTRHRDLVITIAQEYAPQLYHLTINFATSMTDTILRTRQCKAIVQTVADIAAIVREKASKMFVLSVGVSELTKSPVVRDANVHRLVKLVERTRKKNGPIIEADVLRRMIAEESEDRKPKIGRLCPEQRNSDANSDTDSYRDTDVGVDDDVGMNSNCDVDAQAIQNEDDQRRKAIEAVIVCTTTTETIATNGQKSVNPQTINSSSTSTISNTNSDTYKDDDDYVDAFGDSEDNKETASIYALFKRAFGRAAQPTIVHLSGDIAHIRAMIRAACPVICPATTLMAQASYDGWLFNPMVDTLRYITYMQRPLPALVHGDSCIVVRPFSMLVGEPLSEITIVDYAVLPLFCYSETYRRSFLSRVNIAGMIDSLCVLVRLSGAERIERVAQLTCDEEDEEGGERSEGEEDNGDEWDLPTDEVIDDNIEEDLAVVVRRCGETSPTEIARTFLLDFVQAASVGIESVFVSFEVVTWCIDIDDDDDDDDGGRGGSGGAEEREGDSSNDSVRGHSGVQWMAEWMDALNKTEKLVFTMPTDPPGADPVMHGCVPVDQRFVIGLGHVAQLLVDNKDRMPKLRHLAVENLGTRLNWVSDWGEEDGENENDEKDDGMMKIMDQTMQRIEDFQRARTEVEVESVLALLERWRIGSSTTTSTTMRNDGLTE